MFKDSSIARGASHAIVVRHEVKEILAEAACALITRLVETTRLVATAQSTRKQFLTIHQLQDAWRILSNECVTLKEIALERADRGLGNVLQIRAKRLAANNNSNNGNNGDVLPHMRIYSQAGYLLDIVMVRKLVRQYHPKLGEEKFYIYLTGIVNFILNTIVLNSIPASVPEKFTVDKYELSESLRKLEDEHILNLIAVRVSE